MTAAVALLLLGLFAVVTIHAERFLEQLRSRVELEAFLFEPVTGITVDSLGQVVASFRKWTASSMSRKPRPPKSSKQNLVRTSLSVLDFNPPLPFAEGVPERWLQDLRSCGVFLQNDCDPLHEIENVVYRKAILRSSISVPQPLTISPWPWVCWWDCPQSSLSRIRSGSQYTRSAKLIRTMELVGATRTFIRLPFLLEGIWQDFWRRDCRRDSLPHYYLWTQALSSELCRVCPDGTGVLWPGDRGRGLLGFIGSLISVVRFIRPETAVEVALLFHLSYFVASIVTHPVHSIPVRSPHHDPGSYYIKRAASMRRTTSLLTSSVGRKLIMALSGLFLSSFLVIHLLY